MGIVRDITVEELKQAVNNIDTSTLAQDSTLQAVVTAINNISGGNDPVTNTTVNTLGKDTTLQSISAAISGLGQTLGGDKANISGDNIADKAIFRQNIGAQSELIVDTLTGTTGVTGNLSLGLSVNDNMILSAVCTSQNDVFLRTWRASQSNLWFITAINPNTGATVNSTQLTIKYIYAKI